jgi:hypothetical protein
VINESSEIPTSRQRKLYGKRVSIARKSAKTTGATYIVVALCPKTARLVRYERALGCFQSPSRPDEASNF